MNTRLYVDNLVAATTGNEPSKLFCTYDDVVNINITVDLSNQQQRALGLAR